MGRSWLAGVVVSLAAMSPVAAAELADWVSPDQVPALLAQWRATSDCVDQRLEKSETSEECATEFAQVAALKAHAGDMTDALRHWQRAMEWAFASIEPIPDELDKDDRDAIAAEQTFAALINGLYAQRYLIEMARFREVLAFNAETRALIRVRPDMPASMLALVDLFDVQARIGLGEIDQAKHSGLAAIDLLIAQVTDALDEALALTRARGQ
jgi:hypothetical protein